MSAAATTKRAVGGEAERAAAAHLARQGAAVLARNYACRRGEVDIIAQDGDIIAFVEVRRRARLQDAADSIDEAKQRRICAAAMHYLAAQEEDNACCRFDAVLVGEGGKIRWLKDAFWAEEE